MPVNYVHRVCFALIGLGLILVLPGCCNRRSVVIVPKEITRLEETKKADIEKPELLEKTGLIFSIAPQERSVPVSHMPTRLSFFEEQYKKGVEFMEKANYGEAILLFKELMERYPDGEEASVAALCIADAFFKLKSDNEALRFYKLIVEKFPNSRAAENARAAIEYLKNIEVYERKHISVDKSDGMLGRW